jgi:hypothetical protein
MKKKNPSILRAIFQFCRLDRLIKYYFVLCLQSLIFLGSLSLIFPFYLGWYDVKFNVEEYQQKDSSEESEREETEGQEEVRVAA